MCSNQRDGLNSVLASQTIYEHMRRVMSNILTVYMYMFLYHPRGVVYNFGRVCLSVCLSICMYVCMDVCQTTFESLDVGSSYLYMR